MRKKWTRIYWFLYAKGVYRGEWCCIHARGQFGVCADYDMGLVQQYLDTVGMPAARGTPLL